MSDRIWRRPLFTTTAVDSAFPKGPERPHADHGSSAWEPPLSTRRRGELKSHAFRDGETMIWRLRFRGSWGLGEEGNLFDLLMGFVRGAVSIMAGGPKTAH